MPRSSAVSRCPALDTATSPRFACTRATVCPARQASKAGHLETSVAPRARGAAPRAGKARGVQGWTIGSWSCADGEGNRGHPLGGIRSWRPRAALSKSGYYPREGEQDCPPRTWADPGGRGREDAWARLPTQNLGRLLRGHRAPEAHGQGAGGGRFHRQPRCCRCNNEVQGSSVRYSGRPTYGPPSRRSPTCS